jgi:hypothetical protein
VSSFLFTVAILAALVGLLFWARRRAVSMRESAAEREQEAMALLLGSGRGEGTESLVAMPSRMGLPKPIGRLLEDEPSAGSAATAAVAARGAVARSESEEASAVESAPMTYTQAPRTPTPAERAAANLDPIEDLISQILVDPPRPKKVPEAPRSVEPVTPSIAVQTRPKPEPIGAGIPLRELVLAWYEARGYRGSPASAAVWPIQLVLRHRQDAARAYALVVQDDLVSVDRVTALIEHARDIGILRVAVVAEAGYERGARDVARKCNVRLIDRSTMDAELSSLALPMAAKIVAVARKRASSADASPASA